jgi:hypothetical protein
MKSVITLIFAALLSCGTLLAQITENDLPQAGQSIDMTDGGNASADDNQSGDNQTWDFSGMSDNGVVPNNFIGVAEASFTFLFTFSSADFAQQGEVPIPQFVLNTLGSLAGFTIDNSFNFFKREASGLNQIGFGMTSSGLGFPVNYSDPDEIIPIPLELNRSSGGTYSFNLEIPGTFSWACDATRANLVDGRGTLLLPNATYENVYRVKSELSSDNTISITSSALPFPIPPIPFPRNETKYMFFVEGTGWPVLEVTSGLLGSSALYRTNPVDFTSVKQLENLPFNLFPNPSTTQATIQFERAPLKSLYIELFDVCGKMVYSKNVENSATILTETIPVEALRLQNGLYQVRITPDNGKPVVRSLAVQR